MFIAETVMVYLHMAPGPGPGRMAPPVLCRSFYTAMGTYQNPF